MDLNRFLYNQDGSEKIKFIEKFYIRKCANVNPSYSLWRRTIHMSALRTGLINRLYSFGSWQPFDNEQCNWSTFKENMNYQWLQWFQANYEYALHYLYSCNNRHYNARHRLLLFYSLFDLKIVLRSKNARKIQLQDRLKHLPLIPIQTYLQCSSHISCHQNIFICKSL